MESPSHSTSRFPNWVNHASRFVNFALKLTPTELFSLSLFTSTLATMMLFGVARTQLHTDTASILKAQIKKYLTKGSDSESAGNLTSTDYDDVPLLYSPSVEHWSVRGLSKDEVTRMLSQGAFSFPVRSIPGVSRYDGAQLSSNSPCEDRFTHGKFPSPFVEGSDWMAWAVFDGHAGWQTSEFLKEHLLHFVRHNLSQVELPSDENDSLTLVQRAIQNAFTKLDDSIIHTAADTARSELLSLSEKVKKLAPAIAGSCALLALYDPVTGMLHVACTGDSRAVLGHKEDRKWKARTLSVDQTWSNQAEVERIKREHPGEVNIVKDGRVLGLEVSRAFGDSRLKWTMAFQLEMMQRFYGPVPNTRSRIPTPPYLTARPFVYSYKIDPAKPYFMIMATDGLWDLLFDHQAVELVENWLDIEMAKKMNSDPEPTYKPFDFGQTWGRYPFYVKFGVKERTTIQDDNVAVHLMRNALGGNHHELLAGQLSFNAPSSRGVRDDITVQVAFFNGSDQKK